MTTKCDEPEPIVLQKQIFLAREFEIPIFIHLKLLQKSTNIKCQQKLKKLLLKYPKTYKLKGSQKITYSEKINFIYNQKNKNVNAKDRFASSKYQLIKLPPNKFNLISEIIKKSTGKRGPYDCFTGERSEKTIISHQGRRIDDGMAPMFFNIPNCIDLLLHPRNAFRMKIRPGSRFEQKPCMRLLFTDLALCPKDPNQPGPSQFYPQNFVLKCLPKSKCKPNEPFLFYPRSCVPQNERFLYNTKSSLMPGPGRYNPKEIRCRPCYRTRHHPLTSQKTKKDKQSSINELETEWMFRSNVKRLLEKPSPTTIKHTTQKGSNDNEKETKMYHTNEYLAMISNPIRNTISFPSFDYLNRLNQSPKLQFNCMQRSFKRSKLRNNKKVVFMSSTTRFPRSDNNNNNTISTGKTKKMQKKLPSQLPPQPGPSNSEAKAINLMKPFDRLQIQPKRYILGMPTINRSQKIRSTFEPIPKARRFVEIDENDKLSLSIGNIDSVINISDFYKNKYSL